MKHFVPDSSCVIVDEEFGQLKMADCFVYQKYEPADQPTALYIESLLTELGLLSKSPRTSSHKKLVRAMSDFLMCAKTTTTGLIAWPCSNDDFTGGPYSGNIARDVRKSLEESGHLLLVQRSTKRVRLARVYTFDASLLQPWLKFKPHGEGANVEVRSARVRDPNTGQKIGGVRLGRRQFLPEIEPLEDQVATINSVLFENPLIDCYGIPHVRCTRIFNNGSLKSGGRLYGHWQMLSEEERLASTISGEPVVEIDLKASFVGIANAMADKLDLGKDPYQLVGFVSKENCPKRRNVLRNVAKKLIAAYVSNGGSLRQFPQGKRKTDLTSGKTRTVPFREKYDLKHNVGYYLECILLAFPFLKMVKNSPHDFMYMESQVVISSIENLALQGIPAFPVHDCLLVRQRDQEAAIHALQEAMLHFLGYVVDLDVTYLTPEDDLITEMVVRPDKVKAEKSVFRYLSRNWGIEEGFDLIDEYDPQLNKY